MTALQEYIARQTETCRKEWFKEHKANQIGGPGMFPDCILINWQKPGTWTYGCRYILHRRWLIVVGDIGEAVFEWSQDLTPDFLLSINFDYFMGKCQASPSGKDFQQWDGRLAWLRFTESCQEDGMEAFKAACEDIDKASDKEDYERVAQEYYGSTGDAETAGMIASFGEAPSVHAIGMFVGLQMALAQLKT